jgi:hypothetical protein
MVELTMKKTALVTTTLIIALGIYDLICVTLGSTQVSVSAFLINVGADAPGVIFTIGYICGHLFGYMKPVRQIARENEAGK